MTRTITALFVVATALLLSAAVPAQQAEDIGDYLVHYNTMNTNLLPPEVARAYGIQRSGNRAMLNVTVMRKADQDGEMDSAVHAEVAATAINLTGQRRDIELDEIEEEDAIYYVGTFRIHEEETMTFTVNVKPSDSDRPAREITFRKQFFTNG